MCLVLGHRAGMKTGGERVLSDPRAHPLNHSITLLISASCLPHPAGGHTYSVNVRGVIITHCGLNQNLNLESCGLKGLHFWGLTQVRKAAGRGTWRRYAHLCRVRPSSVCKFSRELGPPSFFCCFVLFNRG